MKITFISNFHNHHQLPLCDEWMKNPNVEFTFIATEQVPAERISMGYQTDFKRYSYFRQIGEQFTESAAEQLCYDSDVVIIGSASKTYIRRRLKDKKLTFLYSERFFKEGFWKHPGDIFRTVMMTTRYRYSPFYVLCASAYTALDCRRVLFGHKTLKWGYFPKNLIYNTELILEKKRRQPIHLLWVGRMLEWKHPEIFLHVCKWLKEQKISFIANMIGMGKLENEIGRYIDDNHLTENIKMLGSMSPKKVREHMEKANVFLFTSDYREGWGAVLNEAMNSACAVVACEEAGATGFLIHNERNGLVYHNSNDGKLVLELVKKCVDNPQFCEDLGIQAYYTIHELWNAEVAAQRLYEFCCAFLEQYPLPKYDAGPMSKA